MHKSANKRIAVWLSIPAAMTVVIFAHLQVQAAVSAHIITDENLLEEPQLTTGNMGLEL